MITTYTRINTARSMPTRILTKQARLLRFALTGGLAGCTQLGLLTIALHHGWAALPANAAAFLLAAQLNFALSNLFTWRDRGIGASLGRRWLMFHASIASMALVNLLVFTVARSLLPDLGASVAGICAAATGNFLIGDRLVFRPRVLDTHTTNSRIAPELAA